VLRSLGYELPPAPGEEAPPAAVWRQGDDVKDGA